MQRMYCYLLKKVTLADYVVEREVYFRKKSEASTFISVQTQKVI